MFFCPLATLVASSLVAWATTVDGVVAMAHVHAGVHRALQTQPAINVMVIMKQSPNAVINNRFESTMADHGHNMHSMVKSLTRMAQRSENAVFEALSVAAAPTNGSVPGHLRRLDATIDMQDVPIKITTYWISNTVYIEGATANVIDKLSKLRGVAEIREELIFEASAVSRGLRAEAAAPAWGVERVGAPDLWSLGATGEGVVVGIIDTGSRWDHELIKDNFVGEFGWYDPETKSAMPYDKTGHGTSVTSIIAGKNGVGVAPGVKWMACKSCRSEKVCLESDLNECAQFMLCPTNTNGDEASRDCTKAPRIINNSWGRVEATNATSARLAFKSHVDIWRKAGIIPVFANGNDGKLGCGSANFPGDYDNVIAVGSTTKNDQLVPSSSFGPSTSFPGVIKPDFIAPGYVIKTAAHVSTTGVATMHGSSAASPHVAGSVALLLGNDSMLTYDDVREALIRTTFRDIMPSSIQCGGTPDSQFPNNQFGYGRIDVAAAFRHLHSPPHLESPSLSPSPSSETETPVPAPTPEGTRTPTPSMDAPVNPPPTTIQVIPSSELPLNSTSPAPSTSLPAPAVEANQSLAPTPSSRQKTSFCNSFHATLSCNVWVFCKWDTTRKLCAPRFH